MIGTDLNGAIGTQLSAIEADRLTVLENRIAAGLRTFLEVGAALMEIRDSRLYRAEHRTFEAYCRERWRMGRRNAYQLMDAATVVANVRNCAHLLLEPDSDLRLPANEAQARPLKRLPPDQQAEAWLLALASAPGGRLTAAHVDRIAREVDKRTRMQVHYSSASAEWYTPERVLEAVIDALGHIDLDPCSNCDSNPVVPASRHFTKNQDGLARRWRGNVFMNPPFEQISDWTAKLRHEYEEGHVSSAIALVPARTDTRWFRELSEYPRCFVHGRLNFSGHPNGAPFPSAAFYLGPDLQRFAAAFEPLGDTFVRIASRSSDVKDPVSLGECSGLLRVGNGIHTSVRS